MQWIQFLAEASANSGDLNYITTGAITAVCSALTGAVLYNRGRQGRAVTIEKQPVEIALQKEYVTRTEFSEFKGEMKAEVREMKGLFDKAVTLITERDERLTATINDVAKGAFEGRRRIHETVNLQGEKIAVLSDRADVSKAIGKLGAAMMTVLKQCPKQSNSHQSNDR